MSKTPTITGDLRRLRKHAAIAGVFLAVLCHLVPPDYRAVCNTIASVCTGGLP